MPRKAKVIEVVEEPIKKVVRKRVKKPVEIVEEDIIPVKKVVKKKVVKKVPMTWKELVKSELDKLPMGTPDRLKTAMLNAKAIKDGK